MWDLTMKDRVRLLEKEVERAHERLDDAAHIIEQLATAAGLRVVCHPAKPQHWTVEKIKCWKAR